jgi:DNA-binding NarL/FixJ family response regulator
MTSATSKSLLLIDDHPVYREALAEKLGRELAADGIEVLSAGSASEGLDLADQPNRCWVILLDLLMPGLSGLAGIKVFKNNPRVEHVVAISGVDKQTWEARVVSAGATLFLSKNNTAEFMLDKIRPLLKGAIASNIVQAQAGPESFRLTQRQLEVLNLISQGHPNKIIANFLDISEQTVKIHINQIFKELRVFNRTQAVVKAQKVQLIS